MAEEKKKAPTWKRVVDIVVNVVCVAIVAVVFYISISSIVFSGKQYIGLFGRAFFAVQTGSMAGDNPDSFDEGAVITVNLMRRASHDLNSKEDGAAISKNLIAAGVKGYSGGDVSDGTIITYYSTDSKQRPTGVTSATFVNTHRIVHIEYTDETKTEILHFITKGDANNDMDEKLLLPQYVIGICTGDASGIGRFFLWSRTTGGFLVCVMVPALLVVGYCLYLVIKQLMLRGRSRVKALESDLYEQAKREAMEELMRQQGISPTDPPKDTDAKGSQDSPE